MNLMQHMAEFWNNSFSLLLSLSSFSFLFARPAKLLVFEVSHKRVVAISITHYVEPASSDR